MTTRANLSLCVIYRDDPLLEQAIASVRPYVAEICIVVDEDAPGDSKNLVKRLADRWLQCDWRDDFSYTRNACLALATQPHVGWMDSDDLVVGAENFAREIERARGGRILAPYDYIVDPETGAVIHQQWRERIVPNDGTWIWHHPTHEGLVKKNGAAPIDPGTDYWVSGIRWVHQRKEVGARSRSLAMLRKWYADGNDDAWTHIQLGIELHMAWKYAEAIPHLAKHVELSGWDEEKVLSCIRAADCCMSLDMDGKNGGFDKAQEWVDRALAIRPNQFEPIYAAARIQRMRAAMLNEDGAMARVLDLCRRAIATPETRTPLWRTPDDRAYWVHDLMMIAAEHERDWDTALEATDRALLARPNAPPLVFARKKYSAAKLAASFAPKEVALPEPSKWAGNPPKVADYATGNPWSKPIAEAVPERRVPRDLPAAKSPKHVEAKWVSTGHYVAELEPGDVFTTADEEGSIIEVRVKGRPNDHEGPAAELGRALADQWEAQAAAWTDKPAPAIKVVADPSMPPDRFALGPDANGKFVTARISEERSPLGIVFLCGPAADPWNPEFVERYGAGGSETAVVEMAKRLAKMGHKVRVFNQPGQEGTYEGVDYEMWTPEVKPECDVLIAWRHAAFLPQGTAKVRVAWPHDVHMAGMSYGYSLLADRVFALSDWHAKNLVKVHGIPESQIFRTRNGIVPEAYRGPAPKRNPKHAVYVSSPDRGLGALLDMWPKIHELVPDAELTVAYGFDNWARQADERKDEQHRFLVSTLQRRMRELPGVTHRGRINKPSMVNLLRSSGALLYPGWFQETYACVIAEARAAGMRIVASPIAAIPETLDGWGRLIDGDWLSDDYQCRFIDAAVEALTDPDVQGIATPWQFWRDIAAHAIANLGWDEVASSWSKLFEQLMSEAKHGALPAYREWREVAA